MSDQQYENYSAGYGEDFAAEPEYPPVPPSPQPTHVGGELTPMKRTKEAVTALREQHQEAGFFDRFRNRRRHRRELDRLDDVIGKGVLEEAKVGTASQVEAVTAVTKLKLEMLFERLKVEGIEINHAYQLRAASQLARTLKTIQNDDSMEDWLKGWQIRRVVVDFKRRYPQ